MFSHLFLPEYVIRQPHRTSTKNIFKGNEWFTCKKRGWACKNLRNKFHFDMEKLLGPILPMHAPWRWCEYMAHDYRFTCKRTLASASPRGSCVLVKGWPGELWEHFVGEPWGEPGSEARGLGRPCCPSPGSASTRFSACRCLGGGAAAHQWGPQRRSPRACVGIAGSCTCVCLCVCMCPVRTGWVQESTSLFPVSSVWVNSQ